MNCFVTLLYVCNRKLQLRRSCVFLKIRQISSILWHTYGIYRFVVDTDDDFHGQKDREEALNGWESCHDTQSHSMLSHDWIIKTETYKMRLLSLLFPIRRNLLTPVWRSIRTIEEILEFETCESFSVKFFGLWMDCCWFPDKNVKLSAWNSLLKWSTKKLSFGAQFWEWYELWSENYFGFHLWWDKLWQT